LNTDRIIIANTIVTPDGDPSGAMEDDADHAGDDEGYGDYDPELDASPDELDETEETEDEKESRDECKNEGDRCEMSGDESDGDDRGDDHADDEDGRAGDTDGDADHENASEASARVKHISQSKPKVDPIVKLSNSHRAIIIVPDGDRITSNILQKSEAARIIAIRAKQIESSPVVFVEATGISDSVERAKKELYARQCPLRLRRVVGRGSAGEVICEDWNTREMVLPPLI
jgi:DNA-directed RNA polymerase subunit K/omega